MHVEINEAIRAVLVVEDEMIVAMMIEDIVRDLGVRDVHICPDVASALAVIEATEIDCAILDLRLRDGSSLQVADELARRGIPFLFSSGSDAGALEPRHAARPMISKPFHDEDLKLMLLDTLTLSRPGHAFDGYTAARVATSGPTD